MDKWEIEGVNEMGHSGVLKLRCHKFSLQGGEEEDENWDGGDDWGCGDSGDAGDCSDGGDAGDASDAGDAGDAGDGGDGGDCGNDGGE